MERPFIFSFFVVTTTLSTLGCGLALGAGDSVASTSSNGSNDAEPRDIIDPETTTGSVNHRDLPSEVLHCPGLRYVNNACAYYRSCAELATKIPDAPDGIYDIDPQQNGSKFSAHCSISAGGFTLVLKVNGNTNTSESDGLSYQSPLWNNTSLLHPDKIDFIADYSAKMRGFSDISMHQVRLSFFTTNTNPHHVVLDFLQTYASLRALINSGTVVTTSALTTTEWLSLGDGFVLDEGCTSAGVNIGNDGEPSPKVRIGVIGSKSNGCNSARSFIGVGTKKVSQAGHEIEISAGSGRISNKSDEVVVKPAWILVSVR